VHGVCCWTLLLLLLLLLGTAAAAAVLGVQPAGLSHVAFSASHFGASLALPP
jgi:hypothetical protein